MTGSPSSTQASPPSPRVMETPPVTPTQAQPPSECPPAPRPPLVMRNSSRYFIAANAQELSTLTCSDGDFASVRGTALSYVRQGGEWNLCRPHDVYEQARTRGLLLSPSSCWTQGPMRLNAAFWNRQPSYCNGAAEDAQAQPESEQMWLRPPPYRARVSFQPLTAITQPTSDIRTSLQPSPLPHPDADAASADQANTEQGNR